jgi:hypothetical protein
VVAVVVVARNLEPLLDAVPSVLPPEQAASRLANKVGMVNLVFQFITLISKKLIIFNLRYVRRRRRASPAADHDNVSMR